MTFFHAVLKIDHGAAKIVHFDRDQMQVATLLEKVATPRQADSGLRMGHQFLNTVCDALAGTAEVLVVGSHIAQADFRRYVDKYRPLLTKHIVAWKTISHPTQAQLVGFARQYFAERECEAGLPLADKITTPSITSQSVNRCD
jgi:stalled ribosome rescue protein Dom34